MRTTAPHSLPVPVNICRTSVATILCRSRAALPRRRYPTPFALHGNHLFLFSNEENQKTFLLGPEEATMVAEGSWLKLTSSLVP